MILKPESSIAHYAKWRRCILFAVVLLLNLLVILFHFMNLNHHVDRSTSFLHSKTAVVTLLSSSGFIPGAIALGNSLKSSFEDGVNRICLVSMSCNMSCRSILRASGWSVLDVDPIQSGVSEDQMELARYTRTFSKLHIFRMTRYDQIMFVDADAVVVGDMRDVFRTFRTSNHEIWAAKDFIFLQDGGSFKHDYFSSGVLIVKPSLAIFDKMMEALNSFSCVQGNCLGDQDFLNEIVSQSDTLHWNVLPFSYNMVKWTYTVSPEVWNAVRLTTGVKVLHFNNEKPWHQNFTIGEGEADDDDDDFSGVFVEKNLLHENGDMSELVDVWFKYFTGDGDSRSIGIPQARITNEYAEKMISKVLANDTYRSGGVYRKSSCPRTSVHFKGETFFESLLYHLNKSSSSIHVLMYGFHWGPNHIKQVSELMIRKKEQEGVAVRVVVSRYGSYVDGGCKEFWDHLVSHGIEIVTNDALKFFDTDGLLGNKNNRYRDNSGDEFLQFEHRKLIIIDGNVAFIGGMGLEDHFYDSRDTMVEVEGCELVHQIQEAFMSSFYRLGGRYASNLFDEEVFHIASMFPFSSSDDDNDDDNGGQLHNDNMVQLVHQVPKEPAGPLIMNKYLSLISESKHNITILMSEFADSTISSALCTAVTQRNIRIQVILPRFSRKCVRWPQTALYSRLISCGVNLFEYVDGELHAKMMIVDNARLLVGSANLNGPGLYRNLEANVFIENREIAQEAASSFGEKLEFNDSYERVSSFVHPSLKDRFLSQSLFYLDKYLHAELSCGLPGPSTCIAFEA